MPRVAAVMGPPEDVRNPRRYGSSLPVRGPCRQLPPVWAGRCLKAPLCPSGGERSPAPCGYLWFPELMGGCTLPRPRHVVGVWVSYPDCRPGPVPCLGGRTLIETPLLATWRPACGCGARHWGWRLEWVAQEAWAGKHLRSARARRH